VLGDPLVEQGVMAPGLLVARVAAMREKLAEDARAQVAAEHARVEAAKRAAEEARRAVVIQCAECGAAVRQIESCLSSKGGPLRRLPRRAGRVSRVGAPGERASVCRDGAAAAPPAKSVQNDGGRCRLRPRSLFAPARRIIGAMIALPIFKSVKAALAQRETARSLAIGKQTRRIGPDLGELHELTWLDISGPAAMALPTEVVRLRKLEELQLRDCALRSLPAEVGQLASLRRLSIGACGLTALPDTLGDLAALEFLGVDNNALRALPDTLARLRKLTCIQVLNNPLQGLPDTFTQFEQSVVIWMGGSGMPPEAKAGLPERFPNLSLKIY
jgi:hypothetical protein